MYYATLPSIAVLKPPVPAWRSFPRGAIEPEEGPQGAAPRDPCWNWPTGCPGCRADRRRAGDPRPPPTPPSPPWPRMMVLDAAAASGATAATPPRPIAASPSVRRPLTGNLSSPQGGHPAAADTPRCPVPGCLEPLLSDRIGEAVNRHLRRKHTAVEGPPAVLAVLKMAACPDCQCILWKPPPPRGGLSPLAAHILRCRLHPTRLGQPAASSLGDSGSGRPTRVTDPRPGDPRWQNDSAGGATRGRPPPRTLNVTDRGAWVLARDEFLHRVVPDE